MAATVIPADIARVTENADLHQIVTDRGIRLNRTGRGKCPFCKSPGPRNFSLGGRAGGKQFFTHCCRAGGDAIAFIQKLDSCDFQAAVRTLAEHVGMTLSGKPETPAERRQRERDRFEREMAAWYFRQEWKKARRGMNRAMELGPELLGLNPERWNLAGQLADFYGSRLRWIEANRGTAEGLAEFRRSGVTERQYREWLCGHLRRYAAQVELAVLVCESRPALCMPNAPSLRN
jgi:CHC2 zinc finger